MYSKEDRIVRYHKIDLDNINNLIRKGSFKKAKLFLEEYKERFGEEHIVYKKIYALLSGYVNPSLDEVIKIHEDLLNEECITKRGETSLDLAFLYIKKNDYLSAYKILERVDLDEFDLTCGDIVTKYFRLYEYILKYMDLYEDGYGIDYSIYDKEYSLKKIILSNTRYFAYKYIIDDSFNLEDLYTYITSIIDVSTKTFDYTFVDKYYFKIDNIGISVEDNYSTDILKVVTFPNTNIIITMYPVGGKNKDNVVINETNYNKLEYNKFTRVRTNQVDKFKKKYLL